MSVLGIIPARFDSQRFPGKPLADCGGKTMIHRVYEQASKAKTLQKVIVATDDKRIEAEVRSFGGEVFISQKKHRNGTERCAEVIEQYPDFDQVINIQCDEPFLQPEVIAQLCEMLEENATLATLATSMTAADELNNPGNVKVVFTNGMKALYFSRSPIPFSHADAEQIHYKHLGIYGYHREILKEVSKLPPSKLEQAEKLEQLRWLENGYSIQLGLTSHDSVGINTPEDLRLALEKL